MESSKQSKINVLMLPWLAHGHTSPFLELAKKLTEKNFHIYFCSTPIILNSITQKLTAAATTTTAAAAHYSLSIQLVPLHLPSTPDFPPHYHTTNGLPPHLMTHLKSAYDAASPNFSEILKTLNPDLVIYDHNQPWAAETASSFNIPATQFLTFGAASTCFMLHRFKDPGNRFPFPEISLSSFSSLVGRGMALSSPVELRKDRNRYLDSLEKSCGIVLIKSFPDLEGKYIDYLSVLTGKKVIPVGPLIESPINRGEDFKIMDWLDKKEEFSTVFVSFGSEFFMEKEEIEDLANGLDMSGVNFIWVLRFPSGEEVRAKQVLPEGFLQSVGERGLVVEGWAPQGKILEHKSIGGFVSHCGWSSLVESLYFGVPIVAMPMQLDQPLNAKLVEAVGVGVEVKREEREGFTGGEIGEVIRRVLGEESGKEVRVKAREFSERMRRRGEEEVDGAVEELVKLCRERKGMGN